MASIVNIDKVNHLDIDTTKVINKVDNKIDAIYRGLNNHN